VSENLKTNDKVKVIKVPHYDRSENSKSKNPIVGYFYIIVHKCVKLYDQYNPDNKTNKVIVRKKNHQ
jgi:hypothetical protein